MVCWGDYGLLATGSFDPENSLKCFLVDMVLRRDKIDL